MSGLLLKDYYNLVRYCKAYVLMFVAFLGASIFSDGNAFFTIYPVVMACMLPTTLLAYDEKEHWDQYCITLPISRKQVVAAKYLEGIIITGGMTVLSGICYILRNVINGMSPVEGLAVFLSILIVVGIAPCILLNPINFLLGTTKGRIGYLISIAVICGAAAAVTAEEFEFVSKIAKFMNSELSLILIPVITLILYGVSCLVSIRFYERRDL
ncbi:MAG: ABC-2 transporter permease [Lachnospiraceae bacterium]